MKRTFAITAVVCGALCAASAHAAFTVSGVTMTDLGNLGGPYADAYDINDVGTIVGYSADSLGASRGFYYSGGFMHPLGFPGATVDWALGINNFDHIVGAWRDSKGDHAYLWISGSIIPLAQGAPFYQTVESIARAIADNGSMIGQLHYPHPFLLGFSASNMWVSPSTHFHLYPQNVLLEFASVVEDVDEMGRAVVWDNYQAQAYLVDHAGSSAPTYAAVPPPPPIAGFLFSFSSALGLHENNGVVGSADYFKSPSTFISRAYYWDTTSPTVMLLPTLTGSRHSAADDINGEKFIAGWSDLRLLNSKAIAEVAFIYHDDFGTYALPRGKFDNCHARALNERDKNDIVSVVGWCEGPKGRHAIRWNVQIKGRPTDPIR